MPRSETGHRLISWLSAPATTRRAATRDAVAVPYLADTRIAGRQDDELRAPEVESRGLERGQHAVIVTTPALVGASQRESHRNNGFSTRAAHLPNRVPAPLADGIAAGPVFVAAQEEAVRSNVKNPWAADAPKRGLGRLLADEEGGVRQQTCLSARTSSPTPGSGPKKTCE